jgi:hypothetical protein
MNNDKDKFGFTLYAEQLNGRLAMLGIVLGIANSLPALV